MEPDTMPKFKVKVTVLASFTYETEVEGNSEGDAEENAISPSETQAHLPDDFKVNDGYCQYEFETEQLTAICPTCDTEHPVPTTDTQYRINEFGNSVHDVDAWPEDSDYCRACGDLEDATNLAGKYMDEQRKAGMGHTILLLDAWLKELPYSDRVTRNTLHSHNMHAASL